MREKLLKSLELIKIELPYILLMLLFNTYSPGRNYPILVIVFFALLGFLLNIIIFARGVELIRGALINSSNIAIIKKYFLNYLIVSLILGLPIFLVQYISGNNPFWLTTFLGVLISALTIYVYPFLFIQKGHLENILSGINFLKHNLENSLYLLVLALIPWILRLIYRLTLFKLFALDFPRIVIWIFVYIVSFIGYCFVLSVFYSATISILEKQKTT